MVVTRLIDDAGVRREELHHERFGHLAFVVQRVQQRVVPERRPPFVHHLGLALRIEVLRDLPDDAHDLALPRFEQRRVLLDEVQQILLRILRELLVVALAHLSRARHGAPQIVQVALYVLCAFALATPLFLRRHRMRPLVAIDAVIAQRVAGVEHLLYFFDAVALFALAQVLLREYEVIDDRSRVGPRAIQVVVLEERVVAVARMCDDERLHRHRVLFHEIRDARIRIDHDLVRETHVAALVTALRFDEVLSERPVVIAERHAD